MAEYGTLVALCFVGSYGSSLPAFVCLLGFWAGLSCCLVAVALSVWHLHRAFVASARGCFDLAYHHLEYGDRFFPGKHWLFLFRGSATWIAIEFEKARFLTAMSQKDYRRAETSVSALGLLPYSHSRPVRSLVALLTLLMLIESHGAKDAVISYQRWSEEAREEARDQALCLAFAWALMLSGRKDEAIAVLRGSRLGKMGWFPHSSWLIRMNGALVRRVNGIWAELKDASTV